MDKWFEMLRQAYDQAERPPLRHIAEQAGVSHTHVHAVLTGRALPSRERLAALAEYLCLGDMQRVQDILEQFDTVERKFGVAVSSGRLLQARAEAAEVIAEAIRAAGQEIAAAIRAAQGVTERDREVG